MSKDDKREGDVYKKNAIKPKEQEKEAPRAKISIDAEMKNGTKEAVPEDLQKAWKTQEAKVANVEKALKAAGMLSMPPREKAEMKLENAQENLDKAQRNAKNSTGFLGKIRQNALVKAENKVERAEKKLEQAQENEINPKAKTSFKGEMLEKLNAIKSKFQRSSKEHEQQVKDNAGNQQPKKSGPQPKGHGGGVSI